MFLGFFWSSWVFTVPKESPKCMVSSEKKNSTLNCCKLLGWDYLTNFLILRRGHIVKYLLKQGWNYNSAWRQQGRLKILTWSLKLKDWQLTTDDYWRLTTDNGQLTTTEDRRLYEWWLTTDIEDWWLKSIEELKRETVTITTTMTTHLPV